MIDYSKMNDKDFNASCSALYAEQDRRAKIASIPNDIQKMANDFVELGGDKADLIDRINEDTVITESEAL